MNGNWLARYLDTKAGRPARGLVAAVVIGLGVTLGQASRAAAQPSRGPVNVLLIAADDLGIQLPGYGDSTAATPNLDRLAATGVLFRTVYAAQASCSPSRSSVFTGLFPHRNGQYGLTDAGFSIHPQFVERILTRVLKRAGYRTGLIGKLHVAPDSAFGFDWRPSVDTRRVRDVAAEADRFFQAADPRPFFLMVSFKDPHAADDARLRRTDGFPIQIDGLPTTPLQPTDAMVLPFQGIVAPAQRRRVANYYNSILRVDTGVGLLLERLNRHGGANHTLVIFIGDHGPPFVRAKTTTYEAGVRIPMIIRWPEVGRPGVSTALASTVDIYPTILDAAGLPLPDDLHGRSLRSVLADPNSAWREYLPTEFHLHHPGSVFPSRAIRNQRYKLIVNLLSGRAEPTRRIDGDRAYRESRAARYRGTPVRHAFDVFADPPAVELYDLERDPAEFFNLAGRPDYRAVQDELTRALTTWRVETEDPFLDSAFTDRFASRNQPRSNRGIIGLVIAATAAMALAWGIRRHRRIGNPPASGALPQDLG
ncbi:MAG: sulfatase [Gemmatimonadetes bacterium]|nr:sulfatase [Gemmatimonadota bacterium]